MCFLLRKKQTRVRTQTGQQISCQLPKNTYKSLILVVDQLRYGLRRIIEYFCFVFSNILIIFYVLAYVMWFCMYENLALNKLHYCS